MLFFLLISQSPQVYSIRHSVCNFKDTYYVALKVGKGNSKLRYRLYTVHPFLCLHVDSDNQNFYRKLKPSTALQLNFANCGKADASCIVFKAHVILNPQKLVSPEIQALFIQGHTRLVIMGNIFLCCVIHLIITYCAQT